MKKENTAVFDRSVFIENLQIIQYLKVGYGVGQSCGLTETGERLLIQRIPDTNGRTRSGIEIDSVAGLEKRAQLLRRGQFLRVRTFAYIDRPGKHVRFFLSGGSINNPYLLPLDGYRIDFDRKQRRNIPNAVLNRRPLVVVDGGSCNTSVVIHADQQVTALAVGERTNLLRQIPHFRRYADLEVHVVAFALANQRLYLFSSEHRIESY